MPSHYARRYCTSSGSTSAARFCFCCHCRASIVTSHACCLPHSRRDAHCSRAPTWAFCTRLIAVCMVGMPSHAPEPSVAIRSPLYIHDQPPSCFSSDTTISTLTPRPVTRPGIGSYGGRAEFCYGAMALLLGARRAVAAAESVGRPTAAF